MLPPKHLCDVSGCVALWLLHFLQCTAVFSVVIDTCDTLLDYVLVHRLARDPSVPDTYTVWLCVSTTVTLVIGLALKVKLYRKWRANAPQAGYRYAPIALAPATDDLETQNPGTQDPSLTSDEFTSAGAGQHDEFVLLFSLVELLIFLTQDTTTVFVCWRTAIYESEAPMLYANLCFTIASGVLALLSVVYGTSLPRCVPLSNTFLLVWGVFRSQVCSSRQIS